MHAQSQRAAFRLGRAIAPLHPARLGTRHRLERWEQGARIVARREEARFRRGLVGDLTLSPRSALFRIGSCGGIPTVKMLARCILRGS